MTIRLFNKIAASLSHRPLNRPPTLVTMSLFKQAKFSMIGAVREVFLVWARLLVHALMALQAQKSIGLRSGLLGGHISLRSE